MSRAKISNLVLTIGFLGLWTSSMAQSATSGSPPVSPGAAQAAAQSTTSPESGNAGGSPNSAGWWRYQRIKNHGVKGSKHHRKIKSARAKVAGRRVAGSSSPGAGPASPPSAKSGPAIPTNLQIDRDMRSDAGRKTVIARDRATAGTVSVQNGAALLNNSGKTSGLIKPIAQSPVKPHITASAKLNVKPKPVPTDIGLTQTKPDLAPAPELARDHTIDSPMQAVGDGWKLIAFLLPTLIFVIVCLNLIRRYQQKTGRLPIGLQAAARTVAPKETLLSKTFTALRSGFTANRGAGNTSGMRLVESLNIGAAAIHLVQVRGRTLLIGGGPTGLSVLSDLSPGESQPSEEFREILQAAAADMDGLDLLDSEMPTSAVVGSLENRMRDTGSALDERLKRLQSLRNAAGSRPSATK